LASLLQRRRSTEANQTLHDVWPSLGLVHYIYIFEGSCPLTEFCQVQNSLGVHVLRCPIREALLHSIRVVGVSQTSTLSRGRYLYSAGRPSHWAFSHILFLSVTLVSCGQTVTRIRMPLGVKVGLGPGHIVLDGEPAPPHGKGHSRPHFPGHV